MTLISSPKQQLIDQIYVLLGNNIVDVSDHLQPSDILTAIDITLDKYRQRAGNSQEESILFVTLEEDQQEYLLPKEVMEVREIFRRGLSPAGNESVGNQYDPFNVAYTNLYLLQAGGSFGMFTWELYNQYLETASTLFGGKYNFTWDSRTKKLRIARHQRVREDILITVFNFVPDDMLITDTYAKPWLRGYALAQSKMILGNAYEKFSSIAGPNGTTTLNGSQLKAEAKEEMLALEQDLKNLVDGSKNLGIILG